MLLCPLKSCQNEILAVKILLKCVGFLFWETVTKILITHPACHRFMSYQGLSRMRVLPPVTDWQEIGVHQVYFMLFCFFFCLFFSSSSFLKQEGAQFLVYWITFMLGLLSAHTHAEVLPFSDATQSERCPGPPPQPRPRSLPSPCLGTGT